MARCEESLGKLERILGVMEGLSAQFKNFVIAHYSAAEELSKVISPFMAASCEMGGWVVELKQEVVVERGPVKASPSTKPAMGSSKGSI